MAETFHFSISMISRGKSKSAVASAAYISCEKLTNEWDGVIHDYHCLLYTSPSPRDA